MDINDVSDYIIMTMRQRGTTLNVLKLQKLLYYAQAWHMALHGERLFHGRFQAWPQGPVNREVYNRLAKSQPLEAELQQSDVSRDFAVSKVSEEKRRHLDLVLQAYGKIEEHKLQAMIVCEAPWQEAMGHGMERCEREIDEDHMRRYCTVLYLVGMHERGPLAPSSSSAFQLPANPDAASACNWLARESNSIASIRTAS